MSTSTPSSLSDLSYEEAKAYKRQQIRSDPKYWMREHLGHPNDISRPYDFRTNDGTPLQYLVDEKSFLNPNEWADINVLKLARGCLKTTSLIGIILWLVDTYPQFEAFLTAPQSDAVQEFSSKFKDQVNDTPLEDKRVRDRFSHQKFEHKMKDSDSGEIQTSFSHLKSKSAWDADEGLRGPHCHLGVIDEYQDVDRNTLTMLLEVVDREIPDCDFLPAIFLIGTPKLKNSEFHEKWLMTNQREWDGDETTWIDNSSLGEVSPDGTDSSFEIAGWEIDQYNSPLHDPARIEFKRNDRTEREFENEVLANFYSPEDDLLGEHHVRESFDPTQGFRNSRELIDGSRVIVTADWGGGSGQDAADTVFTAGEVKDVGDGPRDWECTILRTQFLDHDITGNQELDKLRTWISRYDPDHVLVDEGHNGTRRETLQDEYSDLVHGVYFGNTRPAEDVRWNEDDEDRRCFATINKSYVAEAFVDVFKDGKFVIPSKSFDESGTDRRGFAYNLIAQLTAPYKDYATSRNGTKSLKILSDRNDDAFDTFMLLWCGIEHIHGGPQLSTMSMNSMDGYNRRY